MELVTYKCPNCMGAVTFDSQTQRFRCEFCDSVFVIDQLKQYEDDLKKAEKPPEQSEFEWNQTTDKTLEGMNVYSCDSCGAQIVTDETTAASECPYCNNPIVMKQNLSGVNRPDCIIPFAVSKNDAEGALKGFYKGKWLLPRAFIKGNRIEKIKGVYVPFWLFDCKADADIAFEGTTTSRWSDSKYNYTSTKYYHITRAGQIAFERIPADGSSKMDDAYMDAIEPFDYSGLVDFNGAYLSGYLADKYDVGANDSVPRINERVENSTVDAFKSTISGYQSVAPKSKCIRVIDGRVRYALLPVWMLNTKYKDKVYTFAMNGQTGKVVGKLPISKGKAAMFFFGIATACAALGQLALLFFL